MLQLLSSVANVILDDFAAYYNDFMPLMLEILENVGQASMPEKQLRAKAIDAVGSIISAVIDAEERDAFNSSIVKIAEYLSNLIAGGLSDDDPQDTAAKDTLTQCAGFLRVQFAQFMPALMQPILKDANLSLDFKMESADLPTTTDNMAMKVKVKGLGEQRVSLNTENLVKKTSAFGLI